MWKWLADKRRRAPSGPSNLRLYVIGDIHGRADLLDVLLAKIDDDMMREPAPHTMQIFLGDYIDRGPSSRDVLGNLIDHGRRRNALFLKGNHEIYPVKFLRDPQSLGEWRQIGGFETLMSYGLRPPTAMGGLNPIETAREFASKLPADHLAFLSRLQPFFVCGDFFFAHAGVRPGTPLSDQQEEDLLGIRDDFLECDDDFGKVVVHGHTPVREPEIRHNRINIDTGAYATGRLTCLVIEGSQLRFL